MVSSRAIGHKATQAPGIDTPLLVFTLPESMRHEFRSSAGRWLIAQWRCGGRTTGRGAGLGLRGPGGTRPHRHATTAAAAVFVHLALRWGRNWAAQWHLASASGDATQSASMFIMHRPSGSQSLSLIGVDSQKVTFCFAQTNSTVLYSSTVISFQDILLKK